MKATYLEVSAKVQYWEDAVVNGDFDKTGGKIPFKKGDLWCPVIRLKDGVIDEWNKGDVAHFYFKVCDAGEYFLLDENKKRIAKWGDYYVPDDLLCIGENGYGDYIIFKVDADGRIEGWSIPSIEPLEWERI